MKTHKVMVNRGTGSVRVKYLDTEFGCWFWLQDEWGYPLTFGNEALALRWVREHEQLCRAEEGDEGLWVEVKNE